MCFQSEHKRPLSPFFDRLDLTLPRVSLSPYLVSPTLLQLNVNKVESCAPLYMNLWVVASLIRLMGLGLNAMQHSSNVEVCTGTIEGVKFVFAGLFTTWQKITWAQGRSMFFCPTTRTQGRTRVTNVKALRCYLFFRPSGSPIKFCVNVCEVV